MLIDGLRTSKSLVTLSALYIGAVKQHELALLTEIESALNDANRPNLKIQLILDHSRAYRDHDAFITRFQNLIGRHGDRIKVYLYELPSLRSSAKRLLPSQLREILGVYHCKFMVFDELAILTGANLSDEYFVNRQDRYMVCRGPRIVSFLNSFVDIVSSDSHRLLSDGVAMCSDRSVDVSEKLRDLVTAFRHQTGIPRHSCALAPILIHSIA